jgi:hypothetical protein
MHKGCAEDDSDAKHASQQEKTFEAEPLSERTRAQKAGFIAREVSSLYNKENHSNVHAATSIRANGYKRPRGTATNCYCILIYRVIN